MWFNPFNFRRKRYSSYVVALLGLFSLYPIAKTLIDVHVFLSTGRVIGAQDWMDLVYARKRELANRMPQTSKRIVILAGSNAMFSISAERIEQETGIPTINLSSHAGLGGEYLLNRAEPLLRTGDIVLLPLEYNLYILAGMTADFKREDVLPRFLISYDREVLHQIPFRYLLHFAAVNAFSTQSSNEYFSYFQGQLSRKDIQARLKFQKKSGGCYSGLTLNAHGDETCNIGKEAVPTDPVANGTAMKPHMYPIDPGGYIRRFVQRARHKGITLIPLYPISTATKDYKTPAYQESARNIEQFWKDQGFEFQDSLNDSLLPLHLMYNTFYHPKEAGRQKRTERVLVILKKQLNQAGVKP